MFLLCKECGSVVNWENLHMGHLDRDVYRCDNTKCPRSIFHYVEPSKPLPEWVDWVDLSNERSIAVAW